MKGFGEIWQALPRWTILPGDPAPLRAWLRAQAAQDGTTEQPDDSDAYDEDDGRAA